MQIMKRDITTARSKAGPLNLSVWRSFQRGLVDLLDVSISLYDTAGTLLSTSGRDTCVCSAVKSSREGRSRCRREYAEAVAQVAREKKIYIYRCHANQYFFAIPVLIDANRGYVVVGGRVFIEGTEIRDFYEALFPYGFTNRDLVGLKKGIKTIPRGSVFTVPSIVANLAVPFLRYMHAASLSEGSPAEYKGFKQGLRGLEALEEVYKAIAPVLDREELYDIILAKSVELLGAEAGSLMILDVQHKVLAVKAAKGIERNELDSIRVRLGEGISGAIAESGNPVIVKDIEKEVPSRKNRKRYKTRSFISIPLKLDSRVIGLINVTDKATGEVFNEEDLHLLHSFANYATIALERVAYYSMTEELKMISMTDPLTELFNRRYFRERLFEEAERVKRHDECFSIFIMDIDNFKIFNDKYGHIAGDKTLKGVSRAIKDAVRSMDVVARYGGEEFAVILPHTNKKDAFEIAERIRHGVERFRPSGGNFESMPTTISVGVAEFPIDAGTIDDLIDRADKAMYKAKKTGKNRVVVYGEESDI